MSITPAECEKYQTSDNCVGVVDVHEQHLSRVAELLSERHPGILFLWNTPDARDMHTICAVRVWRQTVVYPKCDRRQRLEGAQDRY